MTRSYFIKNNFYFILKNNPPQHYYIQSQNNFVHVYFQISLLGSAKIRDVILQWLCIAFTVRLSQVKYLVPSLWV